MKYLNGAVLFAHTYPRKSAARAWTSILERIPPEPALTAIGPDTTDYGFAIGM